MDYLGSRLIESVCGWGSLGLSLSLSLSLSHRDSRHETAAVFLIEVTIRKQCHTLAQYLTFESVTKPIDVQNCRTYGKHF